MIISAIIPVYNTKEYLPDCLDSIEKQGFTDMEIILVDDGSTDGSAAFCDEYVVNHNNAIVIHKENSGASDARNTGLLAAKGDYIHFIDSDDILLGNHIYSEFFEIIYKMHPDVVLSRFEEYSPDFRTLEDTQIAYQSDGLFDGDILRNVLTHHYPATLTSPVNKLFSRTFLLNNDLFFTKGLDHEEDEWLPRVLVCAKTTWFYNQVIYGVRRGREGSLSETLNEETSARKACSKVTIASSGIQYMEGKNLPLDTMALIADYYWDYLTDACVVCNKLESKENKQKIYAALNKNKVFFKSYKYLTSKNRRMLGRMFIALGIKTTVKLIGIRYGR